MIKISKIVKISFIVEIFSTYRVYYSFTIYSTKKCNLITIIPTNKSKKPDLNLLVGFIVFTKLFYLDTNCYLDTKLDS